MTETLKFHPLGDRWLWHSVQRDLEQQGGLEGDLMVNPFSVIPNGLSGTYRGNLFCITWAKDKCLIVSSKECDHPELVDAFTRVVEYKPFARYREPDIGELTTLWSKLETPDVSYAQLQRDGSFAELTRL